MASNVMATEEEQNSWESNADHLLQGTPASYLVRVREGGGPEDLKASLCVTFIKMRDALVEADRDRRFAEEARIIINRNGSGMSPTVERIREAELRIYGAPCTKR